MPRYGEVKLTNEAAKELQKLAEDEFNKQKERAKGAITDFRPFVEAKIKEAKAKGLKVGSKTKITAAASNYYNAIEPKLMFKSTLDPILLAFGFDPNDETLYRTNKTTIEDTMNPKPTYTITDTRRNVKVDVCFEPLVVSDTEILRGEDWQGARFRDVWLALAEREAAQKLTLCDGAEKPILGLVQMGTLRRMNDGATVLRDNLLEAAPVHRHGTAQRGYKGIGRVLVTRLVEESKAQGAEGQLLVRPVTSSIPFYQALGFRQAPIPFYFRLAGREAEALLQTYTPTPSD